MTTYTYRGYGETITGLTLEQAVTKAFDVAGRPFEIRPEPDGTGWRLYVQWGAWAYHGADIDDEEAFFTDERLAAWSPTAVYSDLDDEAAARQDILEQIVRRTDGDYRIEAEGQP